MDKLTSMLSSLYTVLHVIYLLLCMEIASGDPRATVVLLECGKTPNQNVTTAVGNFVQAMDEVYSELQNRGYGTGFAGSGPDNVYGFAQCYGDLPLGDCSTCYSQARTTAPLCIPIISGKIYLDGCFLRSGNYSYYGEYTSPDDRTICGNQTMKTSNFQQSATRAVQGAVSAARESGGYGRFEFVSPTSLNDSAYVLANCWSTLNASACSACLDNASSSIMGCLPWSEGRVLNTGCFMRYSDVNFLNPEGGNGTSSARRRVIIATTVSAGGVLAVGGLFGFLLLRRRNLERKRKGMSEIEKLVKILTRSGLNFKFSTIDKATGSFDEANKLGQGGFGTVYKGVLADGREIAVKRLFFNHSHRAADFYNEVNIISNAEHKNLVRLLGCSCSGPESLLIYEYLHNKSLDRFIFDPNRSAEMDWYRRYRVLVGTAEGLSYLHDNPNSKIIHRDIKASNILLDDKLLPKIADFGLAKSFDEGRSHISTAIAGTLGYMAPEYIAYGHLSEKVDVYSFGVLILEVISGRQNNVADTAEYLDSLVMRAWRHFQAGDTVEIVERGIREEGERDGRVMREVQRATHVALLCVQEAAHLRPMMSAVLKMLIGGGEGLPPPSNPPFVQPESVSGESSLMEDTLPLNSSVASSVATLSYSFYGR